MWAELVELRTRVKHAGVTGSTTSNWDKAVLLEVGSSLVYRATILLVCVKLRSFSTLVGCKNGIDQSLGHNDCGPFFSEVANDVSGWLYLWSANPLASVYMNLVNTFWFNNSYSIFLKVLSKTCAFVGLSWCDCCLIDALKMSKIFLY